MWPVRPIRFIKCAFGEWYNSMLSLYSHPQEHGCCISIVYAFGCFSCVDKLEGFEMRVHVLDVVARA